MGLRADALLCYGINLGSDDDDFDGLIDRGFIGELLADEDRDVYVDIVEEATERLIAAAGFTERDPDPEAFPAKGQAPASIRWDEHRAWYRRKRAVQDALIVKVVTYCTPEVPRYLLAAGPVLQAPWHRPEQIHLLKLLDPAEIERRGAALDAAMRTLGFLPSQPPGWLMVARYG